MLLQTQNLSCGYNGRFHTGRLDLHLPVGEWVGIMGPNGAGKSTLLKTLMGIQPALSGNYQWDPAGRIGYVPQVGDIDTLYPFTLQDVLRMGEKPRFWRGLLGGDAASLGQVLERLEMRGLKHQLFRELSGGQKQRAYLGRAFMSDPNILILDEPFSSLDYRFRQYLWGQLEKWLREKNASLIWIDHEINHMINHATFLILLGKEQIYSGPTQELLNQKIFSEVYGVPLHIHRENGLHQIHFL